FTLVAVKVCGFCFQWGGVLVGGSGSRRATNRRSDLSIIAPGRCAARTPGTGPLRRSSGPARKKAIGGKSRVKPERHQRPACCACQSATCRPCFTRTAWHKAFPLTSADERAAGSVLDISWPARAFVQRLKGA